MTRGGIQQKIFIFAYYSFRKLVILLKNTALLDHSATTATSCVILLNLLNQRYSFRSNSQMDATKQSTLLFLKPLKLGFKQFILISWTFSLN